MLLCVCRVQFLLMISSLAFGIGLYPYRLHWIYDHAKQVYKR